MARAIILSLAVVVLTACSGASSNNAAAPAPGVASSGAPEKSNLKIGVGGQGQIIYLPLTLADQLGYFKQEGLNVDIQDLKGGADALQAMIGGSTDATMGFYEHTVRTQTLGKFIEMIATCDLYPGLVMFVSKSHPEIKTITDLANRKIGITSAGSSTEEMVRFLFKKNGMDPAGAQTVAVGSGGPAVTALKNNIVDALVTVEPAASTIERDGDGTVLYDTRTEQGTRDVFGGAWPAGGFYVPTDFAQQNPRTTQALARVAVNTLKYINSHSAEDIAAKLPGQLFYPDGDQAFFAKVLGASQKMFSPDGKMPSDGPNNVLETLKAADTQTDWSKVDLSKTFTNALVDAVK
ncbi:MAG: ABC transporter substrate-binding protein [Chloroflexi bacterium]|nr:ABC transporter substrate-binding protein [Chloroflexota bacterium]